jgi:ABC-type phosphate transport system substrate-binding protein
MRKLTRVMAGFASVAAAAALMAGSVTAASADPIAGNGKAAAPAYYDIVGVGSSTTEFVMDQFSVNYNKTVKAHNAAHPFFYSWDATKPGSTSTAAVDITPKVGCSAKTVRPNGSGAGVKALDANVKDKSTGHYCIDFGRSSSGRSSTSPKEGPGGVIYVAFAKDAITWAVDSAAHDAPATLNTTQLKKIFGCTYTNWNQVGGKNAAIKVYLPQAGSGTLSTWEKFMGITTLGSCVSQAPEENEGTNAVFKNNPNAIFIYSVGAYVAQKYHSAACSAKKPAKGQNQFGCNQTGFLTVGKISGIAPIVANKINPKFPATYWRTVYDVLRYSKGTPFNMAKTVAPFFSRTGYLCSAKAAPVIQSYGFVVDKACGSVS